MKRASEAEPIRPNLACSYPDTGTSVLLKKARQLLRGDNRESSASSSCSVNSPLCEKVERNRTGLSSSSVSETDALLLEMTLGGNKELWEMHWLGHKEKMMKGSGDDKTGNIWPLATCCSVNSPFPVESDDDRHRNEELAITEAQKFQMEVENRLTEQLEAQRQLQLKIQEQSQFLQKLIENKRNSGRFFAGSMALLFLAKLKKRVINRDARVEAFKVEQSDYQETMFWLVSVNVYQILQRTFI